MAGYVYAINAGDLSRRYHGSDVIQRHEEASLTSVCVRCSIVLLTSIQPVLEVGRYGPVWHTGISLAAWKA